VISAGERFVKRTIDILLSLVLLLWMIPLMVVLALGAAISLRSWPFFVQRRVGKRGREFSMIKIRTMPTTTPIYADRESVAGVQIPPFCAWLRRCHLDELPQLFHVLEGKMSIVGPRPEMPKFHAAMDPRFAARRTSVTPGCTGLWQATDGIRNLHYHVPEYDLTYVTHASLWLDMWIMWRTLMMLNPLAGTKTLDSIPPWALRHRTAEVIDLRLDLRQPRADVREPERLSLDPSTASG
jgi:lipopolysaccharide/colanic/teichoic acid biosynthesis glycosyltransferase